MEFSLPLAEEEENDYLLDPDPLIVWKKRNNEFQEMFDTYLNKKTFQFLTSSLSFTSVQEFSSKIKFGLLLKEIQILKHHVKILSQKPLLSESDFTPKYHHHSSPSDEEFDRFTEPYEATPERLKSFCSNENQEYYMSPTQPFCNKENLQFCSSSNARCRRDHKSSHSSDDSSSSIASLPLLSPFLIHQTDNYDNNNMTSDLSSPSHNNANSKKKKKKHQNERIDLNISTSSNRRSESLYSKSNSDNECESSSSSSSNYHDDDNNQDHHFYTVISDALHYWPQGFTFLSYIDKNCIQSESFIHDIHVLCPFKSWMKPQHLVLNTLLSAIKNSKHAILESPTGTGKTAAILCGALAFQHNERQKGAYTLYRDLLLKKQQESFSNNKELVKNIILYRKHYRPIYFCTRTHAQISQTIKQLKLTPYRPRVVCLGARKHLCPYSRHYNAKFSEEEEEEEEAKNEINETQQPLCTSDQQLLTPLTNRNNIITSSLKIESNNIEPNPIGYCRSAVKTTERLRRKTYEHIKEIFLNHGLIAADEALHKHWNDSSWISNQQPSRNRRNSRRADPVTSASIPCQHTGCPYYAALSYTPYANRILNDLVATHVAYPFNTLEDNTITPTKSNCCSTCLNESDVQCSNESSKNDMFAFSPCQKIWDIEDLKQSATCSTPKINKSLQNQQECNDVSFYKTSNSIITETQRQVPIANTHHHSCNEMLHTPNDNNVISNVNVAGCPYYTAQALLPIADLIVLPYNYLLSPSVRSRFPFIFNDAIIIFDEAHNVEATCRAEASGSFQRSSLILFLNRLEDVIQTLYKVSFTEHYNKTLNSIHALNFHNNEVSSSNGFPSVNEILSTFRGLLPKLCSDETMQLLEFSTSVWVILNTIMERCDWYIRNYLNRQGYDQSSYERNNKKTGSFVEVKTWGMEGSECRFQGCRPFLEEFGISKSHAIELARDFESLRSLVKKYLDKCDNSSLITAANTTSSFELQSLEQFWNCLGLVPISTLAFAVEVLQLCTDYPRCYTVSLDFKLNEETWFLNLSLMTSAPVFEGLLKEGCRSILLMSGTLSPTDSLLTELGPTFTSKLFRPILHAPHVVTYHQLLGLIVPCLLNNNGNELQAKCIKESLEKKEFLAYLGHTIIKISSNIPGGLLIFLPSYTTLQDIQDVWKNSHCDSLISSSSSIWDGLKDVKNQIFIESKNTQDFYLELTKFQHEIDNRGQAVMIGVYRAKLAEGLSLNDNYVRGVICVGIPYPNAGDLFVQRKRKFNTQLVQQKLSPELIVSNTIGKNVAVNISSTATDMHSIDVLKKEKQNNDESCFVHEISLAFDNKYCCGSQNNNATTQIQWLSGNQWYEVEAFRALNQALGRVIRHPLDFGVFVLLDSRHLSKTYNLIRNKNFNVQAIEKIESKPCSITLNSMASSPTMQSCKSRNTSDNLKKKRKSLSTMDINRRISLLQQSQQEEEDISQDTINTSQIRQSIKSVREIDNDTSGISVKNLVKWIHPFLHVASNITDATNMLQTFFTNANAKFHCLTVQTTNINTSALLCYKSSTSKNISRCIKHNNSSMFHTTQDLTDVNTNALLNHYNFNTEATLNSLFSSSLHSPYLFEDLSEDLEDL